MNDRTRVHLFSLNVRCLKDNSKRKQVFTWLHNINCGIYLLQETHSTLGMEPNWKDDWGNENIYFAHGSSNS